MKTAVVVQARTGSSRLPGKVLLPLAGAPMLARQLERVRAACRGRPAEIVVATTWESDDDPIVELCRTLGVRSFRGHHADLLDRHLGAARLVGACAVAKVPSDCPLIDPDAIRLVLDAWDRGAGSLDYVSNLHPPSWPDGNDVEVMSLAALDLAAREARAPHEREHTTPFLWDQPERFRIANVAWPGRRDLSMTYRLTVDYPEDYALVRAVYDALWSPDWPIFSLGATLAFLEQNPGVRALNAAYVGVNWYRHHLDALRTVSARDTRHAPHHAPKEEAA
jgi:spore coat polysaccharide biosynthesis protein SpsF